MLCSPQSDEAYTSITSIVVNPDKESGRVTLITRYGAAKVRSESLLCSESLL